METWSPAAKILRKLEIGNSKSLPLYCNGFTNTESLATEITSPCNPCCSPDRTWTLSPVLKTMLLDDFKDWAMEVKSKSP
ncbi:hypothetical protein WICPIJ_000372 [Wickerhamomyces pijperi]|uniref:Uncharacterized protein n=1 Tax=Wickerhamomyces pijperi TaxID=599730 RepID=A0A9P8QDX8_WICPI|nr:hypothetical protein WICPIJ_000372 [Wickerhamomyces pijperi]